jgi:two-component system alkaline phosphatase synthesis response regulator PhoP
LDKKKILISDSADLIQALERDFLRRRNFHLLVARDGRQALEVMKREVPDLVCLDLDQPGMDGEAICAGIRREPQLRSVKVILVLSGRPIEELLPLSRAGCHEIVSRPIHRTSLVHLTRRLLEVGSRRKPRYRVSLPILFESRSGEAVVGHARNLSTGGMLLETDFSLPVVSEVTLEFELPGRTPPVRCRGRVAWSTSFLGEDADFPHELGIQFVDLQEEDKVALRAYIERDGRLID